MDMTCVMDRRRRPHCPLAALCCLLTVHPVSAMMSLLLSGAVTSLVWQKGLHAAEFHRMQLG